MLTGVASWLTQQKKAWGKVPNMPLLWNRGPHPQKSAKRPCTLSFFGGKLWYFRLCFMWKLLFAQKPPKKHFQIIKMIGTGVEFL